MPSGQYIKTYCDPVAAVCHKSCKSWEGVQATISLLQSYFLPWPLLDAPGGLDSPAAKYFDAIFTVKINNLIKYTCSTEISVHACRVQPLSAELITWITDSSMALKSGGPCIQPESEGSGLRTPGPPQDRRQCCDQANRQNVHVWHSHSQHAARL